MVHLHHQLSVILNRNGGNFKGGMDVATNYLTYYMASHVNGYLCANMLANLFYNRLANFFACSTATSLVEANVGVNATLQKLR